MSKTRSNCIPPRTRKNLAWLRGGLGKKKCGNIFRLTLRTDLVREYNNTRHPSIKMTPMNTSKKENELRVWRKLYPNHLEIYYIKPKFSVGDKVRISKKKKTFEKGYTTRWTKEIFTIIEVKGTSPVMYKIADLNGEEIKGTFYDPELQKTSQELFRIKKSSIYMTVLDHLQLSRHVIKKRKKCLKNF